MNVEITLDMGIEVGIDLSGGVSPSPEPSGSGGVITGVPVVQMSGVVVPISGVIAGTAEEVE